MRTPIDFEARRDFPKLLNLVRVIAFLHQYQRDLRERGDRRCIEATPADYALAYALARPTFAETLLIHEAKRRFAGRIIPGCEEL
jgi:hypothetical protein